MVELLIVLMITLLVGRFMVLPGVNAFDDRKPILLSQLEAMAKMRRVYYNEAIWFNGHGNVNRAGTYSINQKRCVIQLGFGRYRCE